MENIDLTIDTSVDDDALNPNTTQRTPSFVSSILSPLAKGLASFKKSVNDLLSPSNGNDINDPDPMSSLQPPPQQGQQLPPSTPTSASAHDPTLALASADLSVAPANSTTITLPDSTIIHSVTNPVVQAPNFGQLYTKSIRAKLTTKDCVTFVAQVQQKQKNVFAEINISGRNPKQISNCFSISNLLSQFIHSMKLYALDDVFKIVFPILAVNDAITKDLKQPVTTIKLIDDYLLVTSSQVAQSCKWYTKYTHDNNQFRDDLTLSLSYFAKNVEPLVLRRVNWTLNGFPMAQHGGPLFLKLLLSEISVTNDATRTNIIALIKSYDIKTQHPGENIKDAIDKLHPIVETLYAICNKHLPDKFVDDFTNIFTNTSVEDFNKLF